MKHYASMNFFTQPKETAKAVSSFSLNILKNLFKYWDQLIKQEKTG